MTAHAERVPLTCSSCSPELETEHEVLTTGGGTATVKCTECGHVHKEQLESETVVERDVIVSQDGDSLKATVAADADEEVVTGEEFIVETDEAIMQVRITSLQLGPETRRARATFGEVSTFWTRVVDNVSVGVTLHPRDGRHDETRPFDLQIPGDEEFTVGETHEYGDEEFTVTGIVIREDAYGRYDYKKLDHDGDTALAKDTKRLYAYDETSNAWSAW